MNKSALIHKILDALREEFDSFRKSSMESRSSGNDAESRAEGKYDTRSIEENYLADGLAKQAQVVAEAAAAYENFNPPDFSAKMPIDVGAVMELEFPDERTWFFLAPGGGGLEVEHEGRRIVVFTPESPLGAQVKGLRQGEQTKAPRARILQVL